jgi:hypothetical protein
MELAAVDQIVHHPIPSPHGVILPATLETNHIGLDLRTGPELWI